MTSAKMNLAIIKSIMDALVKANYDPLLASPITPKVGLFTNIRDKIDAESKPEHFISMLRIKARDGNPIPEEQLESYIQSEVWTNATSRTLSDISTSLDKPWDLANKIQEVRDGINAIRMMGESDSASFFEFMLEKKIKE